MFSAQPSGNHSVNGSNDTPTNRPSTIGMIHSARFMCDHAMSKQAQYAVCSHACQPPARAKRARDITAKRRQRMTCKQCGKAFMPPRNDARFSSSACRQRAYRIRTKR